jgi:hypothetical protein
MPVGAGLVPARSVGQEFINTDGQGIQDEGIEIFYPVNPVHPCEFLLAEENGQGQALPLQLPG